MRKTRTFAAALVLGGFPGPAATALEATEQEGGDQRAEEIVVEGQLPVCLPRPGDPLDKVDVSRASYDRQMVIKANSKGVFVLRPDDDPVTGPELWQRAGTALRDYVFRVPTDGYALCIGARKKQRNGWGQLRRVLDAAPLRGKYVRFTAYTTVTRAEEVRFWLAAGNKRRVLQGGDTRVTPVAGSADWARVTLTIGPIPDAATKLSYGFLLYGKGDVWVDEPRLAILAEAPADNPAATELVPTERRVLH